MNGQRPAAQGVAAQRPAAQRPAAQGVAAQEAGSEPAPASPEVTITLCPDGPLLVRGPAALLGPEGAVRPRARAVVALCRCGGSAVKPWCDGTHKVNGFRSGDE